MDEEDLKKKKNFKKNNEKEYNWYQIAGVLRNNYTLRACLHGKR